MLKQIIIKGVNMSRLKIYLKSILIPLLSGALTGLLISGFMDFDALKKPPLSPPALLFPIVWTLLYLLMGISYGMLKEKGLTDSGIDTLYYAQLVVNLLWPVAFFVLKWRLFAFIWILLLLVLVAAMAVRFYSKDKTAGLLQIPYVVWVAFASYLNLGVFILNG